MNSYEKKYLKYKKKYLNLKEKIGGNGIFTIYTTGLSNWLSFLNKNNDTNQYLINIWNDGVRDNIINLVPNKFKINFIHYDPLLELVNNGKKKIEGPVKILALNYISENLVVKDYTNDRVNESIFIDDYINFENLNEPYIILDIAHVFIYPLKLNTVKFPNDNKELNINSVRFGFLGDPISILMTKSKIFTVNDNGTITTYIDKIIELKEKGYKDIYEERVPSDIIAKILKNIKIYLENYIKEIKESKFLYQIEHIINEVFNSEEIIKSILNYIWNDFSYDEILKQLSRFIFEKIIDKIIAM